MKPVQKWMVSACFVFLVLTVPRAADADMPTVQDLFVTDVTTVSFSVIWAASEASTATLEVFEDAAGTIPVTGATIIPHPVNNGDAAIRLAAEDNGVMKVMVTGLSYDTTYYFQTLTTSKSTVQTAVYPATGLLDVTTEVQTVRTYESNGDILPFSNDIIIEPCYLEDGVTPATGTLLMATVAGANYPLTAFVGDGVPSPNALIDLNNAFSRTSFGNFDLQQGENLTLLNFGGLSGNSVVNKQTPLDNSLAEIKPADAGMSEGWNFVAFQLEPLVAELTQFFGDEFLKVDAVWAYDGASSVWSKYKVYDPFNTNDLTDVHAQVGYWVDIAAGEQSSVKIFGNMVNNSLVPLHTGWNLIGYSAFIEADLMDAIAPITSYVEAVWSFEGDIGWEKYKTYDPFNTNNLEVLKPGKAYWVYVNADCDFPVGQ